MVHCVYTASEKMQRQNSENARDAVLREQRWLLW